MIVDGKDEENAKEGGVVAGEREEEVQNGRGRVSMCVGFRTVRLGCRLFDGCSSVRGVVVGGWVRIRACGGAGQAAALRV